METGPVQVAIVGLGVGDHHVEPSVVVDVTSRFAVGAAGKSAIDDDVLEGDFGRDCAGSHYPDNQKNNGFRQTR